MRNGGVEEYEIMVKLYEESEQPDVRIKCLTGIGLSSDDALINRALEYAVSEKVRSQDMMYILNACASTPKGLGLTWSWVQQNWTTLTENLSPPLLANVVKFSTQGFTTNEKSDEVRWFFVEKSAPGIERTIEQCIETISSNAKYIERERDNLREWLNARQ